MADSYTEVTTTGWFGRIGNSIKGIVVGLLLFAIAFPLLFWNEGRAVKRYTDLQEGRAALVSTDAAEVNPALDGQLVHMTGMAETDEVLKDPRFGVSAVGIQLKRTAEMYQWREKRETRTEKQLGGSEKKITTYNYNRVWSEELIDSDAFNAQSRSGHENPPSLLVESDTHQAKLVTVGAYKLSPELIRQVDEFESVPLSADAASKVDISGDKNVQVDGNTFYFGRDPSSPQIGDTRVIFEVAKPAVVSLIGKQTGDTFTKWTTSRGRTVEQRLEVDSLDGAAMFSQMEAENARLTWILRLVGFLMMFIGITLILRPLSVIADVLPILGNIVGFGAALVALILASSFSLLVISVAWVAYRPLLGVPLLIAAVAALALFWLRKSGGKLSGTEIDPEMA